MKKIMNKKIIVVISIIVIVLLSIIIPVKYINGDSYKINQYLKQNYTSYVEFKNNGYILVKKDGKFGIIDYNKNEIIECIYENVNFVEYRDTYLILLKDSKKYILLNSKLEEITNSNNELLVYSDDGYVQTWIDNKFNLINIDNKEIIAQGNIDIEKNIIEYIFKTNYKVITTTKVIENEDKTISEEVSSILYNDKNEIIYENAKISIFNNQYLLLLNEQGYKLIDFYGEDVTIFYSNKIKCKNGEIFLVNDDNNNLVKLIINKTEAGYDVIKEKINN